MRILFLPSWYPNSKSPFDGNFIQNHAHSVALYNEVTVLFCTSLTDLDETYRIEKKLEKNLTEIYVYFQYHECKLIRLYRKLRAYRMGYKELKNYDIIHTHVFFNVGILGIILGVLKSKKVVHTEHSSDFHELSFFKSILFRMLKPYVNMYTPVSKHLKSSLISYSVHEKKIEVIPNAIDIEHFTIKPSPKQKKFHILHISKFDDERKNFRGILNVFEKICEVYDDVILEVGGDGDENWLKETIDSYIIPSDQITVSGIYQYQDFPPVFSNADVFVLFSNFENFGLVLAESMLCGTPVIATNVGGVSDIVSEKNGLLIEKGNEEELYKAIVSFLDKKVNFEPQEVRNSIENYVSYTTVGKAYSEIYAKLLH